MKQKILCSKLKLYMVAIIVLATSVSFRLHNNKITHSYLSTQNQHSINWQLDATVDGVQFYHSISGCNGRKVVFLKFDNTNKYKVNVSWKEVFTTQEGPHIEGVQGQKEVLLSPGKTLETNCENSIHKELVILPEQVNPTYVANISKFEYKDISVTKA